MHPAHTPIEPSMSLDRPPIDRVPAAILARVGSRYDAMLNCDPVGDPWSRFGEIPLSHIQDMRRGVPLGTHDREAEERRVQEAADRAAGRNRVVVYR